MRLLPACSLICHIQMHPPRCIGKCLHAQLHRTAHRYTHDTDTHITHTEIYTNTISHLIGWIKTKIIVNHP